MIYIYCAFLPTDSEVELYGKYAMLLPKEAKEVVLKYRHIHDRLSSLIGRHLLKKCLEKAGRNPNIDGKIKIDQNRRPFLQSEPDIDFNISHSGNYVVCAMGIDIKIGIDIEQQKNISFEEFADTMSFDQWNEINNAQNPQAVFYGYWVRKESIIKANGRGMSIPLTDIHFEDNVAYYKLLKYHFRTIDIDSQYCMCISSTSPILEINIESFDL